MAAKIIFIRVPDDALGNRENYLEDSNISFLSVLKALIEGVSNKAVTRFREKSRNKHGECFVKLFSVLLVF